MGSQGGNRMYLHGGTGKPAEARRKSAIRAYFAGVVTANKTSRNWQGLSRGSERMQGGNHGKATDVRCGMDVYKEAGSKKSSNKFKQNENEHVQINVTR